MTSNSPLRNNVGCKLVCDEGNAVAQVEFALFQPLYLDDVGAWRILQRRNRGIEVAMLLLQARKLLPQLAFFLCRHRRPGCAGLGREMVPDRVSRKWLGSIAFWLMADKSARSRGAAIHSGDFR